MAEQKRLRLIESIAAYDPICEQEAADKQLILQIVQNDKYCFTRDSLAHVTVSAWVTNEAYSHTLLVWHNIYRSWSWIGGHADGDCDLPHVALKELAEETGAQGLLVNLNASSGIFSLEVLPVAGHIRKGAYVSSHVHLNITYLCMVQSDALLASNPQENSGVQWVPLDKAESYSSEPWMCERVYRKLIRKTQERGT